MARCGSERSGGRSFSIGSILLPVLNFGHKIHRAPAVVRRRKFTDPGEVTMKTENGIPMNNPAVAALPKHLLQFAVDQRYDDYTAIDHAVWRFIMRQNIFFLKEYAHK